MGLVCRDAGIETTDRFLKAAEETASITGRAARSRSRLSLLRSQARVARDPKIPLSDGFEKILLFYLPLNDGIELVRVVHGNRDLDRLLMEGFFG